MNKKAVFEQSKKKAHMLFESDLLSTMEPGTVDCLRQIHAYLFGGLYDGLEFAEVDRRRVEQHSLKDCVYVTFLPSGYCVT